MAALLKTSRVNFSYRGKVEVLKDVNLEINEGEFLCVLGPNGSGKSTLMGILSGIFTPSSGKVEIDEKEMDSLDRREIARMISYVPQNIQVDFPFTCREIVMMGRFAHLSGLGIEKEVDHKNTDEAMKHTGITQFADRPVNQISGGERQRVFIAQAIAAAPRIMMLDEPVSALDIKYKTLVLDLVKKLNRDKKITVICVLHDLNLASVYSDRIILVKEGRIAAQGPPREILDEKKIEEVYDTKVKIHETEEGGRFFVPHTEFAGK